MSFETFVISLLNGLSYGLLLFMLSAGLTLIFSMMGVLNFAHASFYMLGAYAAASIAQRWGYGPALVFAPLLIGAVGALFERFCLRRVHRQGHVAELLVTFGASYIALELVQLAWGRLAVPYALPGWLQGPLFTLYGSDFPRSRGFVALVALGMLGSVAMLLAWTRIGLIVRAALTHPEAVGALGHDVPRVFMLVFGAGAALAGLAGVVGGNTYITEPAMASAVGPVIFVVVVVGGMGSLGGAFLAALLIGVVQNFAVGVDLPLWKALAAAGWHLPGTSAPGPLLRLTLSQVAPILPYALLLLFLALRPQGLLGQRQSL
ncbi:branched-chain amino acid ABC transporter permease [Variovorax sp. PDNC026]|uniref:branched-chain amino acid ABC transporter permease n=1 Tax=Variovorax sp. PDNC026 TaxID=2811425 RepID=UPI0019627E5C|nr:branched-chain amino acid ABC transporter permease [Variovorax sp. PDNC026]QRY31847.1 branched-chain amino acid ABC transporter permease [Variovorax sp. PDNC026]